MTIHPGWRGIGPNVDVYSVLEGMGHKKAIADRQFEFAKDKWLVNDRELYKLCSAPFKRNLKGTPSALSQYGLRYEEFCHAYSPDIVEALGTARALELLKKQMVSELEKLAATHPIAVWRIYPETETEKGWVRGYFRMHVMTEEQYQYFTQSE